MACGRGGDSAAVGGARGDAILVFGRGARGRDAQAVVARPARPEALRLAEVVEQDTPAAVAGLAIEDHALEHRAVALALVAVGEQQLLERRAVEPGARELEPTVAILLDDAAMTQQAQRDLQLRLRPVERRLQAVERPGSAALGFVLQRAVQLGDVFAARIAAGEEEALHRLVAVQEEQGAVGALAVASGAARLLVVGVEPARHLVVDDEARVGLVDAEAERVGRDHDARLARHEGFLLRMALRRAQLAVIEHRADAGFDQRRVHRGRRLYRRGVDQARARARRDQRDDALELVALVGHLNDAVVQVRPVHAGVDDGEAADAELARDVGDDRVGRGRGQRQDARLAEARQGAADLEERRPKVVSPLRDAMRLVDDDEADRPRRDQSTKAGSASRSGVVKTILAAPAASAASAAPSSSAATPLLSWTAAMPSSRSLSH